SPLRPAGSPGRGHSRVGSAREVSQRAPLAPAPHPRRAARRRRRDPLRARVPGWLLLAAQRLVPASVLPDPVSRPGDLIFVPLWRSFSTLGLRAIGYTSKALNLTGRSDAPIY